MSVSIGSALLESWFVPTVEELQEDPLRPAVVLRIAGAYFAVPVVAEADVVELFAVAADILLGGDGRMLTGLDGVLFRGQTEGIVAHRVEHVEAFEPLVAGIDIGSDIAQRVTDMQTRSGRMGNISST